MKNYVKTCSASVATIFHLPVVFFFEPGISAQYIGNNIYRLWYPTSTLENEVVEITAPTCV